MKFLKSLFGGSAEKYEDKADELRLDFEYRDAAFYYQQALAAADESDEERQDRLKKKIREVRRKAFAQLLEESTEHIAKRSLDLAKEKLEMAYNFIDDEAGHDEVDRRTRELEELMAEEAPLPEEVETVEGTEGDLFELALSGYDPEDRERALALGEPFRVAYEECQRENWDAAWSALEKILETHPQEPVALELAAMVAENREDEAGIERCFKAVIAADPMRPGAILGLANCYRNTKRSVEARNLLSQAAASRPISADLSEAWSQIHLEHALVLSEGGHHDEGISVLLSLSEVPSANRGFVFFNLAGILERSGRLDDCRLALEHAIEASPRQPMYLERLSDFLVKQQNELDLALKLLVSANEMETTGGGSMLGGGAKKAVTSPNRARYLYKMARIFFLKGEDLEADRTITTGLAVSREPGTTAALEKLRAELNESRASS